MYTKIPEELKPHTERQFKKQLKIWIMDHLVS